MLCVSAELCGKNIMMFDIAPLTWLYKVEQFQGKDGCIASIYVPNRDNNYIETLLCS